MKKFLSLALALVMTMSMVTISAGATFTDDSDIAYSEAVDVMTAIEVVGGYANGSFDPDATLTRGAAAKIICNLMLGPTVAAALGTNTDPFPDVSYDHTFAGYIAYCANEGIISGYSDGTFRPSGTITGYAFMKMLLGALGYDSDAEGYTATNWAVNVSADAKTANLDDGNEDYDGSKAITREEACLYALNTLKAETVSYSSQSNITIGDIVISNNSTAETSGKYSEIEYFGEDGLGMDTLFMESAFSKLTVEAVEDAFGRPALEWTYKSDEVGTYVDPADLVASYEGKVTNATLYTLLGDDDDLSIDIVIDGYEAYSDQGAFTKNSTAAFVTESATGTITEVYEIDEDTYVIAIINTYLVYATADYDADDEELSVEFVEVDDNGYSLSEYNLSIDDFAVSDFEEDDYILVTASTDGSGEYTIQSVAAAEVISGDVSSYASTYVYLDGSKYSYNTTMEMSTSVYTAGEEATVVLDAQGNIIYIDATSASSDKMFFISTMGVETTTLGDNCTFLAGVYFADGTYAEIELDELFGYDIEDEDAGSIDALTPDVGESGDVVDDVEINNWYAYKTNSDGSYDVLASDNSGDYAATTGYLEDTADITNNTITFGGSFKGNSSTVFVVDDGDDVYVYTGIANVPTIEDCSVYVLNGNSSTYAKLVFVDADGATITGAGNSVSDYVLVLNLDSTVTYADDEEVYTYNAIIDGDETTFEADEEVDTLYALYEELQEVDGYYEVGSEVETTSTSADAFFVDTDGSYVAVSYASSVLTIGEESYLLDDDAVIYNVVKKYSAYKLTDANSNYEASVKTGSTMKTFYNNYSVDGYYYVIQDEGVVLAIYFIAEDVQKTADINEDGALTYAVTASIGEVTGDGYSASDFTVVADPTSDEDGETITFTITYTGETDDNDTLAVTANLTNLTNEDNEVNGMESSMTENATYVVSYDIDGGAADVVFDLEVTVND